MRLHEFVVRTAAASTISAEDVAKILAAQPGNKGKTWEKLKDHWITSKSFKLVMVHVHLPELGVTAGKTGESQTVGPIIVEENIQQVARSGGGMHGAAPDFLVLDGQNRVVRERKKGLGAKLQAYVGDTIFSKLRMQDASFSKVAKALQTDIDEYLDTPSMPGSKLTKLKTYVQKGLLSQEELDTLRAEWKRRHR